MGELQLLILNVLGFFLLVHQGKTEINVSAELNCDFTTPCMWRNATDDSGDWIVSSHLDIDSSLSIIPMREGDDQPFAYTGGFMGRTQAVLVSDVVNCQLGGANIKYWYYQTGMQSQLDVCIRQPPGSRDPASLRCYDGVSSTHGHQWIFRVIELPPISQPFEILFRATYYPPSDVIAIDEILFEAALCAREQSNPESLRKRRSSSVSPPLIGYNDWQLLRESEHFKGQTMLIVSQNTMQNNVPKEESTTVTLTTTVPPESTSQSSSTTTTTQLNIFDNIFSTTASPSTTTTSSPTPEVTTPEDELTSTTPNVASSVTPIIPEPSAAKVDPLENFVKLLQQTAPVLPYIPVLVRSLQSSLDTTRIDPPIGSIVNGVRTASGINPIAQGVPVAASHFYNTEPLAPAQQTPNDNFLVDMAKKFNFIEEESIIKPQSRRPTSLRPLSAVENSFGMIATTLRPIEITPTIYPAKLLRQRNFEEKTKDELIDMSRLNTNDIRKLSEIHNKLFAKGSHPLITSTILPDTSTHLIVFQKPTKTESDVANKLTELANILPNGAMNDLTALKDIPDLEGLTRGMDLGLIKKPGGFMTLKKQFIERLMRRTMGLPVEDPYLSQNTNLPPPIVPFKVTRKMMRDKARKMNKRKQINAEGGNAGAGGNFGDIPTVPPKLVEFGRSVDETALSQDRSYHKLYEDGNSLKDIAHRPVNYAAPTFESTTTVQPSPRVGPQFSPMCPTVDCVFDQKTLCNYVTSESSRQNATLRSWQLADGGILNSVTGIPHDLSKNGTFVYAGGTKVNYDETYILSTNDPINILEESRLDFFIFLAGIRGRLRICLNTLTSCPLTIEGKDIDNHARQWKNYHVMLNPGTHAIHFIADRLKDNYAIGLDSIQLLNKFGNTAFAC